MRYEGGSSRTLPGELHRNDNLEHTFRETNTKVFVFQI